MHTVLSRNTRLTAGSPQRRCRQLALAGLLGTTFLVGTATSVAVAAVADEDLVDLTGLTAVSDDSLDKLRGGFSFGGFNINFGLVIKTAINNQQVLMTSFSVETLGKIQDVKHDFFAGWQNYLHDNKPGGSSGSNQPSQSASTGTPDISDVQEQVTDVTGSLDGTDAAAQQAAQQAAQLAAEQAAQLAAQGGDQSAPNTDSAPPPAQTQANTTNNDPGTPDLGAGGVADSQSEFEGFTIAEIENGFVVDNGNGTAVMHQINTGLVTEIINVANGAKVSHATELNVFVSNFSEVVGRHSLFQAANNLAWEAARNNPLIGQ